MPLEKNPNVPFDAGILSDRDYNVEEQTVVHKIHGGVPNFYTEMDLQDFKEQFPLSASSYGALFEAAVRTNLAGKTSYKAYVHQDVFERRNS